MKSLIYSIVSLMIFSIYAEDLIQESITQSKLTYEIWTQELEVLCPKGSTLSSAGGNDFNCLEINENPSIQKSINPTIEFGYIDKFNIYTITSYNMVSNQERGKRVDPPIEVQNKYEALMLKLNPQGYQNYKKSLIAQNQKKLKENNQKKIDENNKQANMEKESWVCPNESKLQTLDSDVVYPGKGLVKGTMKACIQVINGSQHIIGKAIIWYPDGAKASEASYNLKGLDGLVTEWSPNGKKKSEANYHNGLLHGTSTVWLENGDFKTSTFHNGLLHGREFGKTQGIVFENEYNYGKQIKHEVKN